jgi:type II secretory pathway pseudopilin PulG
MSMGAKQFTLSSRLIVLACLVFDLAIITAFFALFGWFTLLDPVKSLLMFLVLILGLLLVNGAIASPNLLFKTIGVAYSTFMISLFILYAVIANVLSMILISGSTVWYIVWELIVLAILIGILAVISFFSRRVSDQIREATMEKTATNSIQMQLMNMDGIMFANQHNEGMKSIIEAFENLKERIHASTPFMRTNDNVSVYEIENKIQAKLEDLRILIETSLSDHHLAADAQGLIEETRRLIMQREQLLIK